VAGLERSAISSSEVSGTPESSRQKPEDGLDLYRLAQEPARRFGLTPEKIPERGKERERVNARSLLRYRVARKLDCSSTEPIAMHRITQLAVSISSKRGKRLADELNITTAEE